MPHINIKCYPGRTEEQKKECAEKIAKAVSEALGCKMSSISVAINDVKQEEWKEKVWDTEIAPDMEKLYKKPGYTCD